MTNEEIKERIPVIKELLVQCERDFLLGTMEEEDYHKECYLLCEELDNYLGYAQENNFDEMMGKPKAMLEDLFSIFKKKE